MNCRLSSGVSPGSSRFSDSVPSDQLLLLPGTVDALEGLLVQQADQVVAGGDELHLLHHDQILVDGLVDLYP